MTFIHKVEEDAEGNQLFTIASRSMEELDDIRWFLGADGKYDITQCILYFMTIGYDDMTKILTRFAELVSDDAKLRMKDIWESIIKGGELATDDQIAALNEKVAALVAARAAKNRKRG